jgi:hypothetical protein
LDAIFGYLSKLRDLGIGGLKDNINKLKEIEFFEFLN